jgi:hypothetical protein
MGCCLVSLFALISPRLALFLLWIFGDVLSRAFSSWIIPLLGFFLLPWTTLVYALAWDWSAGHHLKWFDWVLVALACFIDLSSYAGGRRAQMARAAA